jgi:TldD protein
MDALLADLMDAASTRVDYADARHVRSTTERIATRSGAVDRVERVDEEGFGVRVRVGGAWGFAAVRGAERAGAEAALARALEVAAAQPRSSDAPPLAPEPPAGGHHEAGLEGIDPLAVALEDKLEALLAADVAMRVHPLVTVTETGFFAHREDKAFASTEGARCRQRLGECGGGITATATDGVETQVRSHPASFRGHVRQAGYEHFEALDLAAHAARVGEEAAALLSAPPCPAEIATLVLDGEQLALQLHESVGHAVELDRILGSETSYAGTSFVVPGDAGSLRYGSPLMNVTADATVPGGLGSFGWDDEGVAAQSIAIVREGVLRGFLSSRESAARTGAERSSGCMRASGFDRQPLVRMTNVNVEPGDAGSLADLIAATDRGIYMETNRSWSIDSRRLQFQFATEVAREIRGGELGRLYRNPSYAGVTPEFWAGLDAVCSADEWQLWSVLNCGKGEPGQSIRASHGTAPARFRGVRVGVA